MSAQVIRIAPVSRAEEVEVVRGLFLEYAASLEIDLGYQGFAFEVAGLPGAYAPPDGSLLLAKADSSPAGCVGIRRLRDEVCEMKRLYVRSSHRGSGIGARLVEIAIETARKLRYQEMWLDTLTSMVDAHRLYRRLGFREIAPYGSVHAPGSRFYGLHLVG